MDKLIEKFINDDFIITHHVKRDGLHTVITYERAKKKILTKYETNDPLYARLRFIKALHTFL